FRRDTGGRNRSEPSADHKYRERPGEQVPPQAHEACTVAYRPAANAYDQGPVATSFWAARGALGNSFDDLIRPQQQRRRDREAEGFGGLDVDDEFELGGLLYGQVGGLRALEDLFDEGRYLLNHGQQTWPIGDEAPRVRELS